MMHSIKQKIRLAGFLLITGMLAGIFSVVPAIDSTAYLTEATANELQVLMGASFQFIMALSYIFIGILLYPIIKRFGRSLAIGFLSFRIIAATLVILGTIILLSILTLSQEYVRYLPQNTSDFETLGNVLKATRDYINHVFMIFVLCAGNLMLYMLLLKSNLIPKWLSVWGILSSLLSVAASMLVLCTLVDIITPAYIILNIPTALQELVLAIWLILKGFDNKVLMA